MLWLFTGNKRTRVARNAQTMRSDCPECRRSSDFTEVEVETSAGVWFVDILSDTQRLWRCNECGETFELRERVAPAPARPSAPPPARDMLAALDRERARREAETRRRDRQVEDELAALKKKLGK